MALGANLGLWGATFTVKHNHPNAFKRLMLDFYFVSIQKLFSNVKRAVGSWLIM